MAHTVPRLKPFKCGAAIPKNTFVKFGADKEHVVKCGAGERAIGISYSETTAAEQQLEVCMPGGGAKLKLAAAVALGQIIKSNGDGDGIKASAEGDWCAAMCMEDGVDNDHVAVEVVALTAHAAES